LNLKAQERLFLENSLRHAQENQEFRLLYQPQMDLRTQQLIGFEALIRWEHPRLGLLSPDQFIPIAEETGMMIPMGAWVLRTAAIQWCRWRENGLFLPGLTVNLSVRQFMQKDLVESVGQILRETGMQAGCLVLDLTESMIMTDAETSRQKLEQLKSLGVKLAIDDFGTGYSSLSSLKQFPIDMLKIGRAFIRDINTDPNGAAIVQAILALAGALQIEVLAEGVEHAGQLAFLKREKCQAAQGFLFSDPIPPEQAARWLDEKRQWYCIFRS
jgi:EAL domain-containing protein (putative c-di-GMP-specific phosphodiesterase class I)